MNDVASSKELNQKNQLKDNQFKKMIENNADGIVIIDMNGIVLYLNPSAENLFEKKASDMLGEVFGFPILSKEVSEIEIIKERGNISIAEIRIANIVWEEKNTYLLSLRDISQRKNAEEQLQKYTKNIEELAGIGQWELDLVSNKLSWSDGTHIIFGLNCPSSIESFYELVHPDDREFVIRSYEDSVKKKKPYNIVHRILLKDGTIKYVNENGRTDYDNDGNPLYSIGIIQDITKIKKAEEALRESENRYRTLVELAPDIIYLLNENGRVVFISNAVESIGYNQDDIIGNKFEEYIYPDDRDNIAYGLVERRVGDRAVKGQEVRLLTKEGKSIDYSLSYKSVSISARGMWNVPDDEMDHSDKVFLGTQGIAHDVTDRKQIEEEKEKVLNELNKRIKELNCLYKTSIAIHEKTSIAEACTNILDIIVSSWFYSDITSARIRYYDEEYLSKPFAESEWKLSSDIVIDKEVVGSIDVFYLEKKPTILEGPFSKEERYLLDAICRMLTQMFIRNITTLNLIEARNESERANKAKSDFLANMSHEIRTPLNAIIGMTHLTLQTNLTPKQEDNLKKINFSSQTLLLLINDILDFSKIEAEKLVMDSTEFLLIQVINDIYCMTAEKVRRKGLLFVYAISNEIPETMIGDPLRLGQILTNLLSNAIKFTNSGEVILDIKSLKRDSERITIQFSVIDTGIGLSEKQISNLFKPFSQADSTITRKYGGTGLGLAISNKLVKSMGGEFNVKSEPNKGSNFTFTAEFVLNPKRKEKLFRPSSDLLNLKVISLDKHKVSSRYFEELLKSFTFQATSVRNETRLFKELEKASDDNPFKLLVINLHDNEFDVKRLVKKVKGHPDLVHKPKVIILTLPGREELLNDAIKLGLDNFIVKPLSNYSLFSQIIGLFSKKDESISSKLKENEKMESSLFERIQGAKILLVEDNELNQEVAKELMENVGLDVTIANNGQEAVLKVQGSNFDLVLMDIQMPVMDGYIATMEIRNFTETTGDSKYNEIPIIAMTAHAMTRDIRKSVKAGMNDHITKPIVLDQFYSTLLKWIEPKHKDKFVDEDIQKVKKSDENDIRIPVLDGIDIEDGLNRIAGNRKLYKELLFKFRNHNENFIDQLEEALSSGKKEESIRIVHTLKGVSGNIGVNELFLLTSKLEALLRDEKSDNALIDRQIEMVSKELSKTLSAIGDYERSLLSVLPKSGEGDIKERETNLPEILSQLDLLKEHIENYNADIGEYFETIEGKLRGIGFDLELSKLKIFIEEYNFESALEMMKRIVNGLKKQK